MSCPGWPLIGKTWKFWEGFPWDKKQWMWYWGRVMCDNVYILCLHVRFDVLSNATSLLSVCLSMQAWRHRGGNCGISSARTQRIQSFPLCVWNAWRTETCCTGSCGECPSRCWLLTPQLSEFRSLISAQWDGIRSTLCISRLCKWTLDISF